VKRRRHPWTYNDSHVHRRPREWVVRADMELVRLARGAGGLRLAIGEGLAVLRRRALDLELGFSSNGAYAFERLGQRPRWADDSRRVAERLASLPALRDAVRSGELGWSMAELLARHATPETEAALLDEARTLTFRALRERLERARAGSDADANAGADASDGDGDADPADGARAGDAPAKRTERLDVDGEDETPRRSLSLTIDREVAWALEGTRAVVAAISGTPSTDHFVEALLAEGIVTLRSALPGTFESFLVAAFWHTWLVEDPDDKVAYQHIYQRDRYRCTSPVCSRTDVTPHHLTFRSRGGGEEDENLSSVCVVCHLDLVHGGRITAEPPASRVRWTIGRLDRRAGGHRGGSGGLIEVIGREKVRGDDSDTVTLTVVTAAEATQALIDAVADTDVNAGLGNALTRRVDNALRLIGTRDHAAANTLGAFVHHVEALRGKQLREADADRLLELALRIIDVLGP